MTEETSTPQQQVDIQRIYLKDVSLETPNSPAIFTQQWKPELNLQLGHKSAPLTDDNYEVVLMLTITAKIGDKIAYLAEIQQAGIFTLKGFAQNQLGPMLGAYCPTILFPYARQAIDELTVKGGFPPLMLKPVNFETLYLQHLEAQKAQQTQQAATAAAGATKQ